MKGAPLFLDVFLCPLWNTGYPFFMLRLLHFFFFFFFFRGGNMRQCDGISGVFIVTFAFLVGDPFWRPRLHRHRLTEGGRERGGFGAYPRQCDAIAHCIFMPCC
ncbi:hypothetical protein LY78DRAFT_107916 [Colletotrichum sublineola]|nr:hypothetical protein LY78DRAFT_107916 [Colletotrichum sublineola]